MSCLDVPRERAFTWYGGPHGGGDVGVRGHRVCQQHAGDGRRPTRRRTTCDVAHVRRQCTRTFYAYSTGAQTPTRGHDARCFCALPLRTHVQGATLLFSDPASRPEATAALFDAQDADHDGWIGKRRALILLPDRPASRPLNRRPVHVRMVSFERDQCGMRACRRCCTPSCRSATPTSTRSSPCLPPRRTAESGPSWQSRARVALTDPLRLRLMSLPSLSMCCS